MTARKPNQKRPPKGNTAPSAGRPGAGEGVQPSPKALPKGVKRRDTGEPGGGQGRVDLTGKMPEDIRVDPDITEGHPGYQESGSSEIVPTKRRAARGGTPQKGSAG